MNSSVYNAKICTTLGVAFKQKDLLPKARNAFEKALEYDPNYAAAHYNLGLLDLSNTVTKSQSELVLSAKTHFEAAIASDPSFTAAWNSLTVLHLKTGSLQVALDYCEQTISKFPSYSEAHYNLGIILRQLGRQQDAIDHVWKHVGFKFSCTPSSRSTARRGVKFICVKWGTKYSSDYVNKLASGILRHSSPSSSRVLCLTDDTSGVDENIVECIKLQPGWNGWWNKAQLFNPSLLNEGDYGRDTTTTFIYIDLDTIVTGSLESLVVATRKPSTASSSIGVLGTNGMLNEKRDGGINSSVMIWNAGNFSEIYTTMRDHRTDILKFIYKFDHWLEMMLPPCNVDILQEVLSGDCKILEYKQLCHDDSTGMLRKACLVTFPLNPKPHDYPSPWIKQYWTL